MITPNNVRKAALKVEEENHRFRRFLKTHADAASGPSFSGDALGDGRGERGLVLDH